MTLGSYSHIWGTATPEVWGRTAFICSSETTQQLAIWETAYFWNHVEMLLSLHYSYRSYNQTRDSSWYHSNACQKEDLHRILCAKKEFETVSLPPALFIFPELCRCESEYCRSALLLLAHIYFGDFYHLRGRSQTHFFSMSISMKTRNFLILIFFPSLPWQSDSFRGGFK